MKRQNVLIAFLYFLVCSTAWGQVNLDVEGDGTISGKLGIGTTTTHSSAILDIHAPNKGILIPRVSSISQVSSPAKGLLIFDYSSDSFKFYNGSSWQELGGNSNIDHIAFPDVRNTFIGVDVGVVNTGEDNTGLGYNALSSNTTGSRNTAIGSYALNNNTSGFRNTAVGRLSLFSNNTGSYNSVIGQGAMYWNTEGSYNSGIGTDALSENTTGSYNVTNGYYALYSNTTGNSNIAIGTHTLFSNTNRSNLVAVGDSALYHNGMNVVFDYHATGNTAIGSKALFSNTKGAYNTANGFQALFSNVSGYGNTAIGYQSLKINSTGGFNTANGFKALFSNISGSYNTAMGHFAMQNSSAGYSNVAIGAFSLGNNISGSYNIAIGLSAMANNETGYSSVAVGMKALFSDTNSRNNVAIGDSALYHNTLTTYTGELGETLYKGYGNTAVGSKAMYSNIDGTINTSVGYQSLEANTTGAFNVAIGANTLYSNTEGFSNTALGNFALNRNTTGDYNTAIGMHSGACYNCSTNLRYATALGYGTDITASNQVRVGNSLVTSIGGYANWSNISDKRLKKNIKKNVPGLTFINELNPVTYQMDMNAIAKWSGTSDNLRHKDDEQAKSVIRYTGFLAQEVEEAAKTVGFDFSGVDAPKNDNDRYALRYAEFVVPLVKAVQELSEENKKHETAITQKDKQIAILNDRLDQLEKMMQQILSEKEKEKEKETKTEQVGSIESQPYLQQNQPNPFYQNTKIHYYVPEQAQQSQLQIATTDGKLLRTFALQKGENTFTLNAKQLAAGTYIYTLVIDGRVMESKQMVLTTN